MNSSNNDLRDENRPQSYPARSRQMSSRQATMIEMVATNTVRSLSAVYDTSNFCQSQETCM